MDIDIESEILREEESLEGTTRHVQSLLEACFRCFCSRPGNDDEERKDLNPAGPRKSSVSFGLTSEVSCQERNAKKSCSKP